MVRLLILLALFAGSLRLRLDLGVALLVATLAVEALFPLPLTAFLGALIAGATQTTTVVLVLVVLVTVLLGGLLREAGTLTAMTESLSGLIPDYRFVVAIPPALIGLLPMPAGALVSAPLVNDAAGEKPISPEVRTFVNYWFRHLWEYVWPLYPGLLISAALLHVPVRALAAAQYPLSVAAILVGIGYLLRLLPRDRAGEARQRDRAASARLLVHGIWPFAAIFAGIFVFRLPMLLALFVTVTLVALAGRIPPPRIAKLVRASASPRTILLLVAVMIFQSVLSASGALAGVPRALDGAGIPPIVPLFVAPFLVGLMTGVNQAYVAITFPMLLPLLGGSTPDLSRVAFAYASGFLGILLSPTHLCLVMSREYFRSDIRRVYRLLAVPVAILFAVTLALYAPR